MNVVGLSALNTGRLYPSGNFTGLFKFMYIYLYNIFLLGNYSKPTQETINPSYLYLGFKTSLFFPTPNEHITVEATNSQGLHKVVLVVYVLVMQENIYCSL
jgi:hypothetical protein